MKVVGIHGIAQTYVGPESLKQLWLPALRDGLIEAKAPAVEDADFQMVSFGPVFRHSGSREVGEPRIDPADLDSWEEQLLEAWWAEAAALSRRSSGTDTDESLEIQGPEFAGRVRTPRVVQRALRQLAKSRFFAALGPERALLFGLRQVRRYLHEPQVRQTILERFAACVATTTRVVVAHSLGSIVAYEALCEHPEWRVHTLVTLGSPLGIRNLIFDALTPTPRNGQGTWPGTQRWVNIVDHGDIVALEKSLAPLFPGAEDRVIHNGWRSHDVRRYLSARETGEAIGAALVTE